MCAVPPPKACLFCCSTISAKAVLCHHCGKSQDTSRWRTLNPILTHPLVVLVLATVVGFGKTRLAATDYAAAQHDLRQTLIQFWTNFDRNAWWWHHQLRAEAELTRALGNNERTRFERLLQDYQTNLNDTAVVVDQLWTTSSASHSQTQLYRRPSLRRRRSGSSTSRKNVTGSARKSRGSSLTSDRRGRIKACELPSRYRGGRTAMRRVPAIGHLPQ
jgi:hypothetical protein